MNRNYTLLDINPTLKVGPSFRINSTTIQSTPEFQYTEANVTLVPIALPPYNTNLSDIDPETDIIQQTPLIALGSYQGNIHKPKILSFRLSLNYSFQGMIPVYSTIVRIVA